MLAQIKADPILTGQFIVIAGPEGIGKTTLAAGAPRRLFVPTELGGNRPNSLPLLTLWEQVISLVDEITYYAQQRQFPYQTLVWDSVTAMERLLHDYTIRNDENYLRAQRENKPLPQKLTMESSHGGYGKAYAWANDRFSEFLTRCDTLAIYGGINHVFTSHVFATKVIDPQVGEYDSYELLLHSPKNNKTYGKREILTQRADLIGFLHEPIVISANEKFAQAISLGQGRVLAVDKQPSYTAKNRYGIRQTIPIPEQQGWNALANAIWNACGIDVWNRD